MTEEEKKSIISLAEAWFKSFKEVFKNAPLDSVLLKEALSTLEDNSKGAKTAESILFVEKALSLVNKFIEEKKSNPVNIICSDSDISDKGIEEKAVKWFNIEKEKIEKDGLDKSLIFLKKGYDYCQGIEPAIYFVDCCMLEVKKFFGVDSSYEPKLVKKSYINRFLKN